ncbi:pilus assembly protein [Citrobacter sp. Marseille-Q6884]|uniref:pilus assembly protein n=1 Tax=Citrobacter sp. Marseille-Q6884 TaxID=2956786 RepID=UPI0021B340E1|nr:pilus assembly protein [Citrobacter sp. Marseille-Q6884]
MNFIKLNSAKFIKENRGAVTVATAIVFPVLIGFYSVAIDGARFNSERSRLNDAINQSVYALAVQNNPNASDAAVQSENKQLVADYLSYYLPHIQPDQNNIDVIATPYVDQATGVTGVDYQVTAQEISHPIFDMKRNDADSTAFNSNVTISSNNFSGKARRTTIPETIPTDYAFVVDFSGSMQKPSDDPSITREQVMKQVVLTLGKQVFDLQNGSTMGLVPFSTGVPVVLDKTNYASNSSKEIGCGYIGALKSDYAKLDMEFWYNKLSSNLFKADLFNSRGILKRKVLPQETIDSYVEKTNNELRLWYINTIAKSYGYTGNKAKNWLVKDKGYCKIVDSKGNVISGSALDNIVWKDVDNANIHCDADLKSDINNPTNADLFESQLSAFLEFSQFDMIYGNILNEQTMDISATLSGDYLFDDKNIKSFVAFQSRPQNTPFTSSCYYAYTETYQLVPEDPMEVFVAHTDHFYEDVKKIQKPSYYPIELTDDISLLSDFNQMLPGGNTDTLSGLLRSVPLIAKGKNERKIIFVITDGRDSYPSFRQKLMTENNLCNVITDGLKKYPSGTVTDDAQIYYISLTDDLEGRDLAQEWQNMCVGQGRSYTATSLNALLALIGNIMFKNRIDYVNANEK